MAITLVLFWSCEQLSPVQFQRQQQVWAARAAFPTQSKCIAGWDAGKVCVSAGWRISFVCCFGFTSDQVNGERWGFLALCWVKKQFGNFWLRCSSIIFVLNKTVLLQGCSALDLGLSGTGFSRAAMPCTAPAPPFASPFTMYLMIPDKDIQILLQAPEELKHNSFKNWCLLFSICVFVCIQLALLWTQIHSTYQCCLSCQTTKDWKSSGTYLKLLVSALVTLLLLKFVVKNYLANILLHMIMLAWVAWLESVCKSYSVAAVQLIAAWRGSPPNQKFLNRVLISYLCLHLPSAF